MNSSQRALNPEKWDCKARIWHGYSLRISFSKKRDGRRRLVSTWLLLSTEHLLLREESVPKYQADKNKLIWGKKRNKMIMESKFIPKQGLRPRRTNRNIQKKSLKIQVRIQKATKDQQQNPKQEKYSDKSEGNNQPNKTLLEVIDSLGIIREEKSFESTSAFITNLYLRNLSSVLQLLTPLSKHSCICY